MTTTQCVEHETWLCMVTRSKIKNSDVGKGILIHPGVSHVHILFFHFHHTPAQWHQHQHPHCTDYWSGTFCKQDSAKALFKRDGNFHCVFRKRFHLFLCTCSNQEASMTFHKSLHYFNPLILGNRPTCRPEDHSVITGWSRLMTYLLISGGGSEASMLFGKV